MCCENDEYKEYEENVKELERLLACYQAATFDDKEVVWAVLNKYMPMIEDI